MYLLYLDREAGPNEPAFWVNQLVAGSTTEQVVAEILGSDEYFKRVTAGAADPDTAFVQALYTQLLKREGEPDGVAFWVDHLAALGRAGVAARFLASTEYRGNVVTESYAALLHRSEPPTASEVAYWVNSGMDLVSIAVAMEGAPEFYTHGG